MLPALAILAGLGADWIRTGAGRSSSGSCWRSGCSRICLHITTALAGLNEWTGDLVFLRRDIPRRWNAAMARMDTELPPDARPLWSVRRPCSISNHKVAYNTVFNPETIEQLAKGKTADEFRRALEERNLTHVYVDWKEIGRHREPGGYGFTDFVTPARFADWVAAGVLGPPRMIGPGARVVRSSAQSVRISRPPGQRRDVKARSGRMSRE